MKRFNAVVGGMLVALALQAATGKHIAQASLRTAAGVTVATAQADPNGAVRFSNLPPGEYRLVLTNADGRSVTLADLDGDGQSDIVIEGRGTAAPASPSVGTGAGAGKVNVQDLSITRKQTQGATFGEKAAGGALPGGAVISGGVVAPRDAASGLPTGRRMHKPYACLVDWDGSIKGGFASETQAQAEGQRLPETAAGRCAIRVRVDEQPGTIEVLSWSWGSEKHNKTGHVTLMK